MNLKSVLFLNILITAVTITSVGSASECLLTSRNIKDRLYGFKCGKDIISVHCSIDDEDVCETEIRTEMETIDIKLTIDQFKSLNIFSRDIQSKISCEATSQICKTSTDICKSYKGTSERLLSLVSNLERSESHCQSNNFGEAQIIAGFSKEISSNSQFSINECDNNLPKLADILTASLDPIKRNFLLPISSNVSSFFNSCISLNGKDHVSTKGKFIQENTTQFQELQKRVLEKIANQNELAKLVCQSNPKLVDESAKPDIDQIICIMVEESKIGINFTNENLILGCRGSGVGVKESVPSMLDKDRNSGFTKALGQAAVEQQGFPAVLKESSQTNIGLTPALAKIDQIAPNSAGDSESAIATGAVRTTIPTAAALEAGRAFRPVYDKLSGMAAAASSLGSKSNTAIIGSTDAQPRPRTTLARTRESYVALPQKYNGSVPASANETQDVAGTEPDDAVGASKGVSVPKAQLVKNGQPELAQNLLANGQRSPALDGTGSAGPSATGNKGSGLTSGQDASNTAAKFKQRLDQLKTPEQIKNFFIAESWKYPGIRTIIYNDLEIKNLLGRKQIRIVGRNAKATESGASAKDAKVVFSDNGKNFIPISK